MSRCTSKLSMRMAHSSINPRSIQPISTFEGLKVHPRSLSSDMKPSQESSGEPWIERSKIASPYQAHLEKTVLLGILRYSSGDSSKIWDFNFNFLNFKPAYSRIQYLPSALSNLNTIMVI